MMSSFKKPFRQFSSKQATKTLLLCVCVFFILLSRVLLKNIILKLCLQLGAYMSGDYFSLSRLVFANKIGKNLIRD